MTATIEGFKYMIRRVMLAIVQGSMIGNDKDREKVDILESLKQSLKMEYRRKYKAFPRFIATLRRRWKQRTINEVALLILDNYQYIFSTWFGNMFHLDPNRLEITDPDAPVRKRKNENADPVGLNDKPHFVDFNARLTYIFTLEEIQTINEMIQKHSLQIEAWRLGKGQDVATYVRIHLIEMMLKLLGNVIESSWKSKREAFVQKHPGIYKPLRPGDERPFEFMVDQFIETQIRLKTIIIGREG